MKRVGDWFEHDIKTWDLDVCLRFLGLSETVQKKLPGYTKAGPAKTAVITHLITVINTINSLLHMIKGFKAEFVSIPPIRLGHFSCINNDVASLYQHICKIVYPIEGIKDYGGPTNNNNNADEERIIDNVLDGGDTNHANEFAYESSPNQITSEHREYTDNMENNMGN